MGRGKKRKMDYDSLDLEPTGKKRRLKTRTDMKQVKSKTGNNVAAGGEAVDPKQVKGIKKARNPKK